jgi:hypothetical protein
MNAAKRSTLLLAVLTVIVSFSRVEAEEEKGPPPDRTVNWDMVSDTVATTFDKANAILSGNLEVDMEQPKKDRAEYTTNSIGQRVPKSTAVKAAGSLHNEEPL